jgi:ribosome-associated translation inhibitor RaiA
MYASIDLVFDKINRQLRDQNDIAATERRKHNGGVTQMSGKYGGGNEF